MSGGHGAVVYKVLRKVGNFSEAIDNYWYCLRKFKMVGCWLLMTY